MRMRPVGAGRDQKPGEGVDCLFPPLPFTLISGYFRWSRLAYGRRKGKRSVSRSAGSAAVGRQRADVGLCPHT